MSTESKNIFELSGDINEPIKTVGDLKDLIIDENFDGALDVIKRAAIEVKFTVKSKAARRKQMENLRNYLSNVQQHARVNGQDKALRQEFKNAWSICYDSGR